MSHTFTRVAALSLTLALGLGAWGCKKKEVRNEKCESDCVAEYQDELADCEQETINCLSTCDGPDDYDCVWDCEDLSGECQLGFILCTSSCPCAKEATSCSQDCIDGEEIDVDCAMGCTEEYNDCTGADSPYLCATLCQGPQYSCVSNCEQLSYSSDEFVTCREGCLDDVLDCLGDCQ